MKRVKIGQSCKKTQMLRKNDICSKNAENRGFFWKFQTEKSGREKGRKGVFVWKTPKTSRGEGLCFVENYKFEIFVKKISENG